MIVVYRDRKPIIEHHEVGSEAGINGVCFPAPASCVPEDRSLVGPSIEHSGAIVAVVSDVNFGGIARRALAHDLPVFEVGVEEGQDVGCRDFPASKGAEYLPVFRKAGGCDSEGGEDGFGAIGLVVLLRDFLDGGSQD